MDLITLDFETYYDKDYSLKKLTTEEYVRDPRFEVIGIGIKVNSRETEWASGTHEQIKNYLEGFDFSNSMVLAHNTMFDGAILNWSFGINPKVFTDTHALPVLYLVWKLAKVLVHLPRNIESERRERRYSIRLAREGRTFQKKN